MSMAAETDLINHHNLEDDNVAEFLKKESFRFRDSAVLVCIPVRNEEQTIARVVNKVRQVTGFDVLVIDDQSTDTTSRIITELDCEVLTRRSNAGSRIINGLEVGYLRGYDYVVKIDGDDQHDPRDILRLYEHARKTGADIVIGSRHTDHFDANIWSLSGAGMWFCARLASAFYGKRITDATSGLKIWSRKACRTAILAFQEGKLRQGSTYHTEELLIAARRKLKVEEIPVVMSPREFGATKSYTLKSKLAFPLNLIRSTIRALR